jgi:hypothetical protein
MRRTIMAGTNHFRILTLEGGLSHDTFAIADEQPETIKADCVMVVADTTGQRLTVHGTRLFPAEAPSLPITHTESRSKCLECGRVSGVVKDAVSCPHHQDDGVCVVLEPR